MLSLFRGMLLFVSHPRHLIMACVCRILQCPGLGSVRACMRVCDLVIEGTVMLENPVSILSADVTGCEWLDSACIRFNKWLWRMTPTSLSTRLHCISFCILMG